MNKNERRIWQLIVALIFYIPFKNFGQLQSTWTKTLFYDTGGMSPYHFDSLDVGPSGIAPRSDGKFFVLNTDYEQGQQTIYLIDSLGNDINQFSVGYNATLQLWNCYGLKPTLNNGCVYIEHYYDYGGAPPVTNTYTLVQISSSGIGSSLQTWNYPDVVSEIIPNYHNSYYCKVNGSYVDVISGINYPDSAIGLGPFVNDEFIYSDQNISRRDIDGVVNWSIPSDGYSAVAFSENSIYLVGDSLRKVDAVSGNILWTKELPFTGNYFSLPVNDGLLIKSGRNITVLDSSGVIKGQNTISLTIDPPTFYSQLSDGSIVSGGAFYSRSRYFSVYNRSGLAFKLNEEGHGIIDSTSFYYNGDADLDGVLTFYDDAVIIAAKLNETNSTINLNSTFDYGRVVYSSDWAQSFESGLNLKYSDNNLDNVIDTNDLNMLTSNSPLVGMWQYPHQDSTGIPLYCVFADSAQVDGDTITYYIIIGNVGEPIDSVYGISLLTGIRGSVSYDAYDLQFKNGVLGDTATDLFIYSNNPSAPIIKSYVSCRTDHQNIVLAGGDTLATVKCILNSMSVPGLYPAFISAHIIGKEGYTIPYHLVSDTINLIINSVSENYQDIQLKVYPTPANNELNIVADKPIKHVTVTDAEGRVLFSEKYFDKKINIPTIKFSSGIYFIQCDFVEERKVVKAVISK